jgi:peptidylprolyl isomerase
MVQTGDPQGTGAGGPGYRFADEPVRREYEPGTVAMANAGPNTNGSQFFIMHGARPLPKNYTIFGRVTSGMDVVDRIANTPVRPSPQGEQSVPTQDVRILDVVIEER